MKYLDTNNIFKFSNSFNQFLPNKQVKVQHIFLDLEFDLDKKWFGGSSVLSLEPILGNDLSALKLNAVDLDIESVYLSQKELGNRNTEVDYSYDGKSLTVFLKEFNLKNEFDLQIKYAKNDSKLGVVFVGPDEFYPDKCKQVWTGGEQEESRYWIPTFDDPTQLCTSETKIKVNSKYMVVANGDLVEEIDDGEFKIFHHKMSQIHANYLIALAIGEFIKMEDSYEPQTYNLDTGLVFEKNELENSDYEQVEVTTAYGGAGPSFQPKTSTSTSLAQNPSKIPVNYYTRKGLEKDLQNIPFKTPRMMQFYSQKFGVEYPWTKYDQVWVHEFTHGGMENTTVTHNTDKALPDIKATKDFIFGEVLVAHELSHQWFGDLVILNDWGHLWVKEGMATYSEQLWWQHEHGDEAFDYYRHEEHLEYLSEAKSKYIRPTVSLECRDLDDIYDRHTYTKAGCIYHMIRVALKNDTLFTKSLQTFLTDNKHQNVETADLLKAITKATGYNLKPIIDQYILKAGHPIYKVSYSWDQNNKIAKLTVTQKQVSDSFNHLFDLEIPVVFANLNTNQIQSEFSVSNSSLNQWSSSGKNYNNLSLQEVSIKVDQETQDFYFNLDKKPDFICFDFGNHTLKEVELDYPLSELKTQLMYSPSILDKIYAAQTLGKKQSLEVVNILKAALKAETSWQVRKEIITVLGKINLDQVVTILIDSLKDKSVEVQTEAVVALSKTRSKTAFEVLFSLLDKDLHSYHTESQLLIAISKLASNLTLQKHLHNQASHYLPDTHISSDEKELNYVKRVITLVKKYLQSKMSWNDVLRSNAVSSLSYLKFNGQALDIMLACSQYGVAEPVRMSAIKNLGRLANTHNKLALEKVFFVLESLLKEDYIVTEMSLIACLSDIDSPKTIELLEKIKAKTLYGRVNRMCEQAILDLQKKFSKNLNQKHINTKLDKIQEENQTLKSRLEALELIKNTKRVVL